MVPPLLCRLLITTYRTATTATHATIVQAAAMAPMERLLNEELCWDSLETVFAVVKEPLFAWCVESVSCVWEVAAEYLGFRVVKVVTVSIVLLRWPIDVREIVLVGDEGLGDVVLLKDGVVFSIRSVAGLTECVQVVAVVVKIGVISVCFDAAVLTVVDWLIVVSFVCFDAVGVPTVERVIVSVDVMVDCCVVSNVFKLLGVAGDAVVLVVDGLEWWRVVTEVFVDGDLVAGVVVWIDFVIGEFLTVVVLEGSVGVALLVSVLGLDGIGWTFSVDVLGTYFCVVVLRLCVVVLGLYVVVFGLLVGWVLNVVFVVALIFCVVVLEPSILAVVKTTVVFVE